MPTVERGLRLVVFCSMEIAGDRPSIAVDVRLAHQFQELPRIGRQALDVAALALGVDRVERQRGLAGPGQAGDHRQLSRGMTTSTFFRLCSRAPRTWMEPAMSTILTCSRDVPRLYGNFPWTLGRPG